MSKNTWCFAGPTAIWGMMVLACCVLYAPDGAIAAEAPAVRIPDVDIPETGEASTLAKKVIKEVNDGVMPFIDYPDFRLEYEATVRGRASGRIRIYYDFDKNRFRIKASPDGPQAVLREVVHSQTLLWDFLLYPGIFFTDARAVKEGDGYVVRGEGEGEVSTYLVSSRYDVLLESIRGENGSVEEIERHSKKIGDHFFHEKIIFRKNAVSDGSEVAISYAKHDERVLPEKISVKGPGVVEGADEYELRLVGTKFKEEKKDDIFGVDDENAIGDKARWDDLSKKVIPEIVKRNEDMGTFQRKLRKAECTIDAQVLNQMINTTSKGKLKLEWEDLNEDGITTGKEINISIEDSGDMYSANTIKQFRDELKLCFILNTYNIFQIHHVKTKKVPGGYLMTMKPVLDFSTNKWVSHEMLELKVSKDYRILEMTAKLDNDAKAVAQYKHKKVGGKWLVLSTSGEASIPGVVKISSEFAFTYEIKGGIAYVSRIEYADKTTLVSGSIGTTQQYDFHAWKIKRRDEPLGVPEPANQD